MEKNFFSAPLASGLGATRRAAMLLLVMMLTTVTTWAATVTLTSSTSTKPSWTNGNTYVTNGNVTIANRITVTGNVTLILNDGDTLTASKGIEVRYPNSLTIKGGNNGTGTLTIEGCADGKAGIGGGSGTLSKDPVIYGNITIIGGIVNVKGGAYGAGIGGNNNSSINGCGTITINGGIVNATGGNKAAGIGGGCGSNKNGAYGGCGDIVINGGQVTATGGGDGPGIGPGKDGDDNTSGSLVLGWTNTSDFIQVTGVNSNEKAAYGFSNRLDSISFAEDKKFNISGGEEATTGNIKNQVSLTLIPKGSEQYQLSVATISGISASYDLTGSFLDILFSVSDDEGNTLTLGTDYTAMLGTTSQESTTIHITEGGKYTLTINGMGSYAGSKSIDFEVISIGFKKDANGVDYINMPKNGIYDANIPEGVSSFKVYDDGGAKAKYSNSYDGGLVLTAPANHFLQLTGTVTAEVQVNNPLDYLMVYDGGSTSAPKIGGKFGSESGEDIDTLISSGKQMTLTFHSDNSGQRDGLDLTVTLKRDLGSCDIANIDDQPYTGSAIEPAVVITYEGTALVKGVDYEVTYSNNTLVGTATITITGMGNYAKTTSKTFTIVKATPTVSAPASVDNLIYSGGAQNLVVAGTTNFGTLLYSLDGDNYSEDIPTATDAGTYTVYYKVAGDDNLNEISNSLEATIASKAVTNDDITITIPSQVWTGSELTPVITVKDGETVLAENTDYTVTAPDGTIKDAGDYTYTITGKGNYSGETTVKFTIIPKAVTNDGITIAAIADQTYTGSAIEPEVTVTDGETTLTLGTDYTIGYSANVNVGTATATITGKGNYSGEKAATFTIIPKAVTNDGITIAAIADQTYTGSAIEPEVTVNDGETTLTLGTDYEVAYSNNISAGTATVTISGKGNYSGEKAATFTIAPKLVTNDGITVTIQSQTWTGNELTPVITVTDGETELTLNTDYTVTPPSGPVQNAGDYTYTITGMGNYAGSREATFTISLTLDPADISVNAAGTEYTIHTAGGWNAFCDLLAANTKGYFSGKTVKLDADIAVSRMAGGHEFTGTFDGDSHTLTLAYGTADTPVDAQFIAPFVVTSADGNNQPAFRNLTIDGTIYASNPQAADHYHVGGLIGHLFGDVTIEHCNSLVHITAPGGAGGFVGLCEHTAMFTDCLSSAVITSPGGNNSGFVGWSRASGHAISFDGCTFNGKLLQQDGNGSHNGGFIGWTGANKTVTFTNCLCAPATLASGETMASGNSATFARGWNATTTATNSYYTQTFGDAQGTKPIVTASKPSNIGDVGTAYNVSGITAYGNGLLYGSDYYCVNSQFGEIALAYSGSSLTATIGESTATVSIPEDVTVNSVTYNREFTADKPATVMLPFNKAVSEIGGGTFYTFGGVKKENNKWEATMNEVTGSLTKNTPYLFVPTGTSLTFTGGATLNTNGGGNRVTADAGSHWTFKGTYEYKEWISGGANAEEIGRAYGFAGVAKDNIDVGDFVKVANGAKIRPMCCYLLWNNEPNSANARSFTRGAAATDEELPQRITVRLVGSNGEVTGIGTLDTETGEMTFDSEAWYTLDGVRLSGKPTQKGLYINNGKKIVIK